MPTAASGFTGSEIVSRVVAFVGDSSSDFRTYLQNMLPMAEFRYCAAHPWSFLRKTDIALAVTSGTNVYTLNAANLGTGINFDPKDVEMIYSKSKQIVLKKVPLIDLRRLDPADDDGTSSDTPTMWAQIDHEKIEIWPPTFETGTLYIQGQISPAGNLAALGNYPVIPFNRQDGFIEYCIALALDYADDVRADMMRQKAMLTIQQDIEAEVEPLGDTDEPRVRSLYEVRLDGVGANLNALLFGWLERD